MVFVFVLTNGVFFLQKVVPRLTGLLKPPVEQFSAEELGYENQSRKTDPNNAAPKENRLSCLETPEIAPPFLAPPADVVDPAGAVV
jgi:hypothetical protein